MSSPRTSRMASTAGPVLGAFAFIFTEEFLKVLLNWVAPVFGKRDWAEYWAVLMGPLLILSVIFFRRGLAGIFYKPDA